MTRHTKDTQIGYNPHRLLDTLLERLHLSNDSALSRKLKLAASIIDDIRHGRIPVAASMLILMSEASGISVPELRALLGDRRTKFRLGVSIAG